MRILVSDALNELIDLAAKLSVQRAGFYIGVEHLFEAALEDPKHLPQSFVDKYWEVLLSMQGVLREDAWRSNAAPADAEPYFTPRCAAVSKEAGRIAQHLRSAEATAAHLLVAILTDDDSGPSRAADTLGLDRRDMVGELIERILSSRGEASGGEGAADGAKEAGPAEDNGKSGVTIEAFLNDLTRDAREGKIEPALGRDQEIRDVVQVLSRKEKSNVVIVGEAGVGKTKLVEGIAIGMADGSLSHLLRATRILELNVATLLAGTAYRGAFEKKIVALLDGLERSQDTILFIDEIHLIMGAGATDGDAMDLANILKPALGRGRIRCIGATTPAEYSRFIAKDPAMERRFQQVRVGQLSEKDTYTLLKSMTDDLERHHEVEIGAGTVTTVVKLAERFLPGRQFPDKAIDVLDQACARFHFKMVLAATDPEALADTVHPLKSMKVTPHDVQKVISQMTGVPVEELTEKDRDSLKNLQRELSRAIIGQRQAIRRVAGPIQKARAGMADPRRPRAVFLFLGPTGVGKTELAKELARQLMGSDKALVKFDMSDYIEEHSVSKLIGAPPGYVGSEEDGQLYTALTRSPHAVLLFDEVEKAHPKVFDLFLPILEEGHIKDAKGRDIDFRNSYIIFTSNIAADAPRDEGDGEDAKLYDALEKHFRREFINRIDEVIPFTPLRKEDVIEILKRMVREVRTRLADQDIDIRVHKSAYHYLANRGYKRDYGARELRRAVERLIAEPVAKMLIDKELGHGDVVDIRRTGRSLRYEKQAKEDQDQAH